MRVLVFDIDGTLTETTHVDELHFIRAVRDVLPQYELDSFRAFTEFTDTAILGAICVALGEEDYASIEAAVHARFLEGLERAAVAEPEAFATVAGGAEIFDHARGAGWVPAVATGGWRSSAELKLATAGIPMSGVPLVTSSEHPRRVEIIEAAVSRAVRDGQATEVVYVGDGVWDVRACRELGIGFLGRAHRPEARRRLTEAGARVVIDDFRDPHRVLELAAEGHALRPR